MPAPQFLIDRVAEIKDAVKNNPINDCAHRALVETLLGNRCINCNYLYPDNEWEKILKSYE